MPERQQEGKDSFSTRGSSLLTQAQGWRRSREASVSISSDRGYQEKSPSPSSSPSTKPNRREQSVKKGRRPDQQFYVPRSRRPGKSSESEEVHSPKQSVSKAQNNTSSCSSSSKSVRSQKVAEKNNLTVERKKLKLDANKAKPESFGKQKSLTSDSESGTFKQFNGTVINTDLEEDIAQPATERTRAPVVGDKQLLLTEGCTATHAGAGISQQPIGDCPKLSISETEVGQSVRQPEEYLKLIGIQKGTTKCTLPELKPANKTVERQHFQEIEPVTASIKSEHPRREEVEEVCNQGAVGEVDQGRGDLHSREAQQEAPTFSDFQRSMEDNASAKDSTGMSSRGDKRSTEVVEVGNGQVTEESAGKNGNITKGPEGEKEVTAGGEEEEDEGDSWDTMFDDEGNLKYEEVKEITDALGGVSIAVKKPAHEYYNFSPKDTTDYSKLEHVIEAFDFPASFQTQDLVMSFSSFKSKGFDINWVDDTHALIVFSTPQVAQDALCLQNPMLRTRHLSLSSKQSKQKAKELDALSLQPYRPRPETSATAARRMVAGALGLKPNVSKEERAAERQKLKEAREKKREEKKQKSDSWEGNI